MKDYKLLSVGDFASSMQPLQTTTATLHHYDKIGLLSPVLRRDNNYRYYSSKQLIDIRVIRILQKIGMSLSEIKNLTEQRTPELVEEMLTHRIDKIDSSLEDLLRSRKLLITLLQYIRAGLGASENNITIRFLPSMPIVFGEPNDYGGGRDIYDALFSFYQTMSNKYPNLDLNYPVCGFYSAKQIKQGNWTRPNRYYFFNPDGNDRIPAAFYAVGYTRTEYGRDDALYEQMVDFIGQSGFEICGGAYEKFLLNEICVPDDTAYLMQVMITVRKKLPTKKKT